MLETDTLSETAQRARSAATVLATLGTDVRDSVLAGSFRADRTRGRCRIASQRV